MILGQLHANYIGMATFITVPRKEEAEAIDEDFDPPENEKALGPGLGSWVLLWGCFTIKHMEI